jgi:hypothetical protein
VEVNDAEWVAAHLKKGQNCWFRKKDGVWQQGEFRMSYFYDGVIARVRIADPDDVIELSLFLDADDEIAMERPEPPPVPLPSPKLGEVYYRAPICMACDGTGLWRCTNCVPSHVEFCGACSGIDWGDS